MARFNRVFNHAKPCLNCGKKAKKKTKTWYGNEPYKGNLKIISKHELYCTLWDGESYEHYCGFFCTNNCAMHFADDIVTGRIRMSYKKK
tara:strand:+ start:1184 stop:1450 length:267 start_codon:yes stop_codon:yes gene_type:complete